MTQERWRRIEDLYHSVSEREPGKRSACLVEACRGDEALRHQVESLLAPGHSPILSRSRQTNRCSRFGHAGATIRGGDTHESFPVADFRRYVVVRSTRLAGRTFARI